MVQTCSYIDCNSKKTPNCDLNFFSFPLENPETLKAWVLVSKSGFVPTKWSKLCSKHFSNTDYQKTSGSYVCKLKENVVPQIPTSSQPPVKIRKIDYQTTSGTSLIKEHVENELSEVVNPTLTTTIKAEADYFGPPETRQSVDTPTLIQILEIKSEIKALKLKVLQLAFKTRQTVKLFKKTKAETLRLEAEFDDFKATHPMKFISSRWTGN